MTQVLDWHNSDDSGDLVHHAVQTLARGGAVAFPTETVYTVAVSALFPEAVEGLWRSTQRGPDRPLTVAVQDNADALDWVPDMSPVGRRLARRCWPGPVTLAFAGVEQGLISRLPEAVRPRVCPAGSIRLRSAAHEAIQRTLPQVAGPLVLSAAHRTGEAPPVTAGQVLEKLGDAVDIILDAGPTRYGQSGTVVQVNGASWSVLRPGVVSEALLRRQTAFLILFVCTGNTCRSPLAEALSKKQLADRLGCTPADLSERGFLVLSAGLAAMMGGVAAAEAVEAAQELGADLTSHRSRPLSAELANQADCIVAMTQSHLLALTSQFPHLLECSRLLNPEGTDIPDPIGSDREVYRQCAAEIARLVEDLVGEWVTG
jgi:protein-tyrosine phosphatase